jgi:hypothetical protein
MIFSRSVFVKPTALAVGGRASALPEIAALIERSTLPKA